MGLLGLESSLRADEFLPILTTGGEVYSNVTVIDVTVTDIYFRHARGIGNAKLRDLDPQLQRHFHYNPAKARATDHQQAEANARYATNLPVIKPPAKPVGELDDDGNVVPPFLCAHSFRGQRPPQIVVEDWLTPPPDVKNKFVLVEFWLSSADVCRQAIPHLNALYAKYKDRLVIIGLSNESVQDLLKAAPSIHIDYSVGTDPHARTWNAVQVQGVPHAILIDPKGIVRFEGLPSCLTEEGLGNLMDRYEK
jgi:thiol-disulfide isomerase/thioredoxin